MKTKTKTCLLAISLALGAAIALAQTVSDDHDPFDIWRTDPNARNLRPLIYSLGRDETSGINNDPAYVTHYGLKVEQLGDVPSPANWPRISPGASRLGEKSEGSTDNIHNHLLGSR